jgi:hypothetical protein
MSKGFNKIGCEGVDWVHLAQAFMKMVMNINCLQKKLSCIFQEEARTVYLMEKYGHRWRQKSLRGIMPLKLTDAAWLKQVLFNPSSRLARQVACNMLESLCQVPVRKREVSVSMTVIVIILDTLPHMSS